MAFRLLNQNPVYFSNTGVPLAGGSLTFSVTGTSTPKTTYSDKALSVPNSNPVTLDSAGRANTDVWGTGNYRVVLKDSGGSTIWTRDDVDDLSATGIPSQTGNSGKYLTTDGSNSSWAALTLVPSVTGNANKYLYTDGSTVSWRSGSLAPAIQTVTSAGTLTPDAAQDGLVCTALATNVTIAAPAGTWSQMQGYVIRIKDNGTARTITFNAAYRAIAKALPTTTTINKEIYIAFVYDSTAAKYDVTWGVVV